MMCGMRKATSGWEDDCAQELVGELFKRGRPAPTEKHVEAKARVVDGDDFTFAGTRVGSERTCKRKCANGTTSKCMAFWEVESGTRARWTEEGLEYTASNRARN